LHANLSSWTIRKYEFAGALLNGESTSLLTGNDGIVVGVRSLDSGVEINIFGHICAMMKG
jgi:hypothetical protein